MLSLCNFVILLISAFDNVCSLQIDFQLCCYCSPVVDINSMFSMVKMDEKISKEQLIVFYHQELVTTLKTFGYSLSPPTLLDLNLELLMHGKISVFMGICYTSFAYIDTETMDINDLFEAHSEKSINFRKKLFEHPVCKSILQRELKTWLHKGFFDE